MTKGKTGKKEDCIMKKVFYLIGAFLMLAACSKNAATDQPAIPDHPAEDAAGFKVSLTISRTDAFGGEPETRATVKKEWADGDVVFVFFQGVAAPKYLEMKYTGGEWVATFKNDLSFNVEYRDARTLALNIAALQLVETLQKSFVVGASYKIANFNTILKMKKKQEGVNNDLTLNFNLQFNNNTALIRKIDVNTTQATSGTRTLGINLSANYVMSKRITLGAFFDHQVNTPLVSTTAYPTTNTNYGISLNISLTK